MGIFGAEFIVFGAEFITPDVTRIASGGGLVAIGLIIILDDGIAVLGAISAAIVSCDEELAKGVAFFTSAVAFTITATGIVSPLSSLLSTQASSNNVASLSLTADT